MRLLKLLSDDTFELTTFDNDDPPPYAILSHTWTEGQEVTYQELEAGAGRDKVGFDKIRFCGKRAAADGLQYFWVDTCCIDKTSSFELGTAINYMFRWYQRSSKCYVYLSDVSAPDADAAAFPITWMDAFRRSRWFKRGWTLQELIAPASVEFFSREHKILGSRKALEHEICKITGIPASALRGQSLDTFSVEERQSWMSSRETTVKEDRYYCLLGIFDVFLPLIPGEGEKNAKMRLEEEIEKRGRRHASMGERLSMKSRDYTSRSILSSTAQPEARRPACVIPFPRDPDFVDRGTLINDIRETMSRPMSRVALVGIGGVGKSQLSLEYCYRTREASPVTHILWAHASNVARLEESFRDIADRVKMEGRQDSQANIFKLVHDWLCDTDEPWLLVLDNVDDASFLLSAQAMGSKAATKPLREYLPYCDHGSILVTSRSKGAALELVEPDSIFALNPMNAPQAQILLSKKLGKFAISTSNAELTQLATVLEYMPLALFQAAAYISQRAPFVSVAQYLQQFKESERGRTKLLSFEEGQQRRDREATNSIITTWQISFQHIQRERSSAADLLSLMSFFDHQGIPKYVLQMQAKHEEDEANRKINESKANRHKGKAKARLKRLFKFKKKSRSSFVGRFKDDGDFRNYESDDDAFMQDVAVLRNYAFISVGSDTETFEMHALMQFSMRTWLAENAKLEHYKERFINKLCAAFPTGKYETWAVCQTLFAHAQAAADQKPDAACSLVQWAKLLYCAGWYADEKGDFSEAKTLATLSLKAYEKILGLEHECTLWSKELLVHAYTSAGNWDDAEELALQLVEFTKTNLGAEHLETLDAMSVLASVYIEKSQWGEAEELQLQALEGYQTKFGVEDRTTLLCMSGLALIYQNQSRWNEAEELQLQVTKGYKADLGLEHLDTLISMGNLAFMWREQGKLEEAERLQLHVLDTCRTKLGIDHPETLIGMSNLALVYLGQDRLKEAELLQTQVLETRKTNLGVEHPDTLISMNHLACIWKALSRNTEAIALMEQCAQGQQHVLRDDHPNRLGSLKTLEMWRAEQEENDSYSQIDIV